MDNTQAQVLTNFRSLFGRYKAVVAQNERIYKVTVGTTTTEIPKTRQIQTQATTTKL